MLFIDQVTARCKGRLPSSAHLSWLSCWAPTGFPYVHVALQALQPEHRAAAVVLRDDHVLYPYRRAVRPGLRSHIDRPVDAFGDDEPVTPVTVIGPFVLDSSRLPTTLLTILLCAFLPVSPDAQSV